MKFLTFFFALLISASAAQAQSANILDQREIRGWSVSKLQTPRDGLSCQAFKCNKQPCNAQSAASIRLWGSQNRRAVTPMIGMATTQSGAKKADIVVGGKSFALEQRRQSKGRLFIAKEPSDDARIMEAIVANPNGQIEFRSEKGTAIFRLAGVSRVLNYFARECGIPKP